MVDIDTFRNLALSMPDAYEAPHFEIPSFRFKKKIFATYHPKDNKAMVKLSLVDQSAFCSIDSKAFHPVPGGWGLQGATYVELDKAHPEMFADALKTAYEMAKGKKK